MYILQTITGIFDKVMKSGVHWMLKACLIPPVVKVFIRCAKNQLEWEMLDEI